MREAPAREAPAAPGGDDDAFANAFAVAKPSPAAKGATPAEKKSAVYIPPAPGSTNIPESLGQSDILEVALAHKAALAKCAQEQRAKDPGKSGTLVMRWTIETSGRTSKIGVVTQEFKGTHMAACVGAQIKGWQFPRHKKQGEPVNFPFKF